MADRITLGGIGVMLAGLTLLVTLMGAMVVLDYTSGRFSLDSNLGSGNLGSGLSGVRPATLR